MTIVAALAGLVLISVLIWAVTRPNEDAPPPAPDVTITITGTPIPE
ncbi:hypothetical protein [Salinibacterium sp. ZJ454]|nr:hypothetical protein [Salinibacterium sp. ZJ454]